LTTPLNKNYWAETESLSAETDTSHLNKTKHRDRDFTCGAETVRIGYSAEMTSNQFIYRPCQWMIHWNHLPAA
jgi:hypothetical protein